jgi:hypothetical protein
MVRPERFVPFALTVLLAVPVGCALETPSGPETLDMSDPHNRTHQTTYVL